MNKDQEEHVLERLSRVTKVRARKMFGGLGLYSGELFFALIAHDVLYLKVDDINRHLSGVSSVRTATMSGGSR